MLRREAAIVVFTTAFISLAYFGTDVLREMVAGNWESIMDGIVNSIVGIVIALIVLLATGWWLVKDARKAEKKEDERHQELIDAIKSIPQTILKAIQPEEEEQNGESKPDEPTNDQP